MYLVRGLRLIFVLCALSSAALADTLKDEAEARQLTDRVMAKVGSGDVEGGLQIVRPYSVIPPAEFDVMLGQFRMQQSGMDTRFGKSLGAEFIREDRVGKNLLRIVQLHRFERHAMNWHFYFYRGKDGWVLNVFDTSDKVQRLF